MSPRQPLRDIEVVILAGGKGTRLRPAVSDRPKVLALVDGRPFLDYLLSHLRALGVRRIILALGHLHRMVERHVRHDADVVCSVERRPLGTGGALRLVLSKVRSRDVLVLNGDSLARADLGRFARFHRSRPAQVSVLLARVNDASRFGRVSTDRRGRVTRFGEKSSAGPGYVNAGVYLFRREALKSIPARRASSLERDVFPRLRAGSFYGLRSRFDFIDIGTPESYRAAAAFLRKGAL